MDDILLSDEAYEILKRFASSSSLPDSVVNTFPEQCLDQLFKYKLISSQITDYDLTSPYIKPIASETFITEKGLGYLSSRQSGQDQYDLLKSMADSAKRQALSAEQQAALAIQNAKSAQKEARISHIHAIISDVLAIIAIIISIIALRYH
ncbi:hypothetical protein ACTNEQ_06860 [Blautia obeum]|uniref:hypothetical protein n=1 Tax=Blautia obeum TaxID=40520 RepID=UPI003F8970F6